MNLIFMDIFFNNSKKKNPGKRNVSKKKGGQKVEKRNRKRLLN